MVLGAIPCPPPPPLRVDFIPAGDTPTRSPRGSMQATLDAVVDSAARAVRPIVREEIVPMLERNPQLAREFGQGLGAGVAERTVLPVTLAAGALAVGAAALAGTVLRDPDGKPSFVRGVGVVGVAWFTVWLLRQV